MSEENSIDRFGHRVISVGGLSADIYALLANFSTLSNFILGTVVSFFILFNQPLDPLIATRMVVLGASFDAVDGRLARRSNTKPKLGAQFDTAADQMSFAAAPGLIIFDLLYPVNFWFAIMVGFIYFFSASFRLSRFMMEPTSKYFNGMPSPVSAIFIAAWYVIPDINLPLFAASAVFISLIMISSLPYTAMKSWDTFAQKFYAVFTISLMLLLTYAPNSWMETLGIIWVVFILYFSIGGPAYTQGMVEE